MNRTPVPEFAKSSNEATPAQIKYITDLVRKKDLDEDQLGWVERNIEKLDKKKASIVIDRLKNLKDRPIQKISEEWPEIPAGRYAVYDEEDVLKFYQVDRPTEGKWAGMLFLSIRASDERYPIKSEDSKERIFQAIM